MFTTKLLVGSCACALLAMPAEIMAQNAAAKILVGDVKVQIVQSYSGREPLPMPADIQIEDFRVSPDVIAVDNSAAARLHARRLLREGQSPDISPDAAAQNVQSNFSAALLKEFQKTPIAAIRNKDNHQAGYRPGALIVGGEFTNVDEGNRSKRIMIGFGRGASDVQAHVTVRLTTDTQPILISEFKLDSASGKKPGAAATMGVGSAAAAVAVKSVGDQKATVEGDVSRMAKAVAKQVENVMAAQGWIPPEQPTVK